MGVSLVTTQSSDFIKDFPAQWATNANAIDAYANSSLTTHGLKSYTPIFTATVSNPVIGTGGGAVLRAYYYEIFDQIYTWGEFRFGTSGPTSGSGIWIMSLPFAANTTISPSTVIGAAPIIGEGSVWCNLTAGNRQPMSVHLRSSTTMMFGGRINAGGASREFTNTFPIAWAVQDGLSWSARYQRAP